MKIKITFGHCRCCLALPVVLDFTGNQNIICYLWGNIMKCSHSVHLNTQKEEDCLQKTSTTDVVNNYFISTLNINLEKENLKFSLAFPLSFKFQVHWIVKKKTVHTSVHTNYINLYFCTNQSTALWETLKISSVTSAAFFFSLSL